ncbi:Eco47II family restriction endonuclease [Corynebacterium ammoniagenes]|uniref:Type II restriction endonuclease n=1 Tax=Corynebacterium ammoniagenes TaxID=1697 RepID=A0AAV5G5X4_CORAM|nr:Eco47II family restriction endonuclease [Corynebacterium ammoniagenes]GJN41620.1 type II restriction endonuclease [Corynebacterium ammoniagenes]
MPPTSSNSIGSPHDLPWLPFETLCDIVDSTFRSSIRKVQQPTDGAFDPTLVVTYSSLTNTPVKETVKQMQQTSSIKTMQNAIGAFHQKVLGAVNGWSDSGPQGGGFDIISDGKVPAAGNRRVLMEVKMRWNTIKASDQHYTHQRLAEAVKHFKGQKNAVAYLAQIIPAKQRAYDEPWVVSGRTPLEYVRAADGKTTYHLVTGHPNALEELLRVLPHAFNEVLDAQNLPHLDFSSEIDIAMLDERLNLSLPQSSALHTK